MAGVGFSLWMASSTLSLGRSRRSLSGRYVSMYVELRIKDSEILPSPRILLRARRP
jgi:hypothetical protein